MKVPPLQTLIVHAIPPQSIARHIVLAAAVGVFVLCGAASVQSAPAAPPLHQGNAVQITHSVPRGSVAVLEAAEKLSLWQPAGPEVFGDDEEVSWFAPAGAAAEFFRVQSEVRPVLGKARWELAGARWLVNDKSGARYLSFHAEGGSGAQSDGAAFTWEWRRTGRDAGVLTLTWPAAVVETLTVDFTATNAGVWTSERTVQGLPAGAAQGTFRDDAGTALVAAAPADPGTGSIALAGPGRAQGIQLTGLDAARISSPAGGRDFSLSYSLTGADSALLFLACADGSTESCALTFTGPGCGTYEMMSELHGVLRRTTAGVFTIAP